MSNIKIAVLLENFYEDIEAWYPYLRLREEGIETVFLGTGKKNYRGKHGYPANEDLNIENVNPDEFSGVVIPGGYAPDFLRRYNKILEFVKTMDSEKKLVASICHAAWVPISAGILKNRTATCFSGIKDDLINAGAEYVDREVVVDKNLITSRKVDDLPFFCREIINFLKTT